jgi:hypothetical protein
MLAVNYFAHSSGDGGGVPNNSTLALWFLARLFDVTRDRAYLELAEPMVRWLSHVQLDSGELPYALATARGGDRVHFLCHQYNAFEFMDLAHYLRMTGDESVRPLMESLAGYLSGGIAEDGHGRYDCSNDRAEVVYYTAAIARALSQATALGLGDYAELTDRAYRRVLRSQSSDGGFGFSTRTFGFLADRRSYPRAQSMILHHLLVRAADGRHVA